MNGSCRLALQRIGFAALAALTAQAAYAQTPALRAGPMLGYSQMREVAIWVQTTAEATASIAFWPSGAPDDRRTTAVVATEAETAFTATMRAERLQPGTRYEYEVLVDGQAVSVPYPTEFQTQTLWQWRTDPPEFSIALASCFYVNEPVYDRPGTPYGSGFEILQQLETRRPDAMVWVGDNTYLREVDWHSRSGILERYSHTRAYPGLQPLLASTHHYATWDDHDFGPNNSDRSYWAKPWTHEAFQLFWPNPSYGTVDFDGVATTFEWGDVLFVLLDNRYHRSPNDRVSGQRTMLGEAQLQWLVDTLAGSSAPFKFVVMGGQALNPFVGFETYATYPEERQRLLDLIEAERIPGVIFASGDRHRTELTRLEREGTYPLYDLTVSPLTAGVFRGEPEPNALRVEGTLVQEHNFAMLRFSGPRTARVLEIVIVDNEGNERWQRSISSGELR